MSKHYFIGIRLPEKAAVKLAGERDGWKLQTHKLLVPAPDLHITLVYLGADGHGELPELIRQLKEIRTEPFELTVSGTGTFGNPASPRVVYGRVEVNHTLIELQREVAKTVRGFQFGVDRRDYTPHVTLAKKWIGTEPFQKPSGPAAVKFQVDEFSLFQVNLGQNPRYEAVQTFHVRGDG